MMIFYEDPPITAALTPEVSRLYMDFHYWSERLGGKHTITAPFDFDWDSIHRWKTVFYWWLKGRAKVAALIHDDLYQNGRFAGEPITRLEADQVFLDAMEEEMRKHREYLELTGFSLKRRELADKVRRSVIYIGVRIGGQDSWDEYRAAEMPA